MRNHTRPLYDAVDPQLISEHGVNGGYLSGIKSQPACSTRNLFPDESCIPMEDQVFGVVLIESASASGPTDELLNIKTFLLHDVRVEGLTRVKTLMPFCHRTSSLLSLQRLLNL